MPRLISSAMLTALAAPVLNPAVLVEANFRSGPVRLWSGMGPIVWGGHTWTGVGSLGSIAPIDESSGVEARGTMLRFSGFDASLLEHVLEEFATRKRVTIYLGLFNAGVLIVDPAISWRGMMDRPTIEVSGETAEISIACESRMNEMDVAVDRRYTNDDQQRDYPGDLGLSFVNAIQERGLYWGTSPTTTGHI